MKLRYISQQRQFLRSLYTGIGKTAVILPSAFLVEAGLGMLILGMIFFMCDVYRVTPGTIGFFSALWQACYFCGCLIMRQIFKRVRPRYLMIISTACMSLFVIIILLFPSIVVSFICYGLFGLALSLFWPPLMGLLSFGIEGTDLSRAMSRVTIAGCDGMIISPFLAGLLSEIAPELPVYGAAAAFLSALLMITGAALALPRIRHDYHPEGSDSTIGETGAEGTLLRYPAWIGLFVTYVSLGALISIFPMYARVTLQMSKSTIGVLFLTRALFTAFGFIIMGRFNFWHFKPVPMIAGLGLLAFLLILMSSVRSFFFWRSSWPF